MSARAEPVWDRFVRVFHWSLVACVAFNLLVQDDGEPLHRRSGYLSSGLVLARIVWGFIGSRHARFADFFPRRRGCAPICRPCAPAGRRLTRATTRWAP